MVLLSFSNQRIFLNSFTSFLIGLYLLGWYAKTNKNNSKEYTLNNYQFILRWCKLFLKMLLVSFQWQPLKHYKHQLLQSKSLPQIREKGEKNQGHKAQIRETLSNHQLQWMLLPEAMRRVAALWGRVFKFQPNPQALPCLFSSTIPVTPPKSLLKCSRLSLYNNPPSTSIHL